MTVLPDDMRRVCHERRGRSGTSPAHVVVPLAFAVAVVVLSGFVAKWLGLPTGGVWTAIGATAVVAGLAAHRTIGSLAAGAGIRLAQPYAPGEYVRVYVPSLDRVAEAEVVRVGPANTTLLVRDMQASAAAGTCTADGSAGTGVDSVIVLPNNVMLRGGLPEPTRR